MACTIYFGIECVNMIGFRKKRSGVTQSLLNMNLVEKNKFIYRLLGGK